LRKIRLCIRALHELLQASLHSVAREEFAKNLDLAPQFIVGNRLDEFFGRRRSLAIKFADLGRGRPRHPQSLSFGYHLTYQPDLLSFGRVEASSREQQVADYCITKIPLQARNSAEARDESQSK